jgi:DNA-binding transcriptional LysR family regulator
LVVFPVSAANRATLSFYEMTLKERLHRRVMLVAGGGRTAMNMISLHMKHFETFFWAARLGSFTAAAERLNSTQSAVSMRIAELELRFGRPVFDRLNRKVVLTPKGEELMDYVERLLRLVEEIQERVAAPETIAGVVRIGVTEVVAQTWLPHLVEALHRRYPNVKAKFTVALTQEVMEKLHAGVVDLALAPGRSFETAVRAESLGTVVFEWMASSRLSLPLEPLGPAELQAQRIIVLPRESFHHRSIEAWFQANKILYRPDDECNSMSVVALLTASGVGISLLPPICYQAEIAAGTLRVLETTPRQQPVEFFAITIPERFEAMNRVVVDLAIEVSTFFKS